MKTAADNTAAAENSIPDPARFRPIDVPVIEADISKLQRDTGWQPQYSAEETIADTLSWWRAQLTKEQSQEQ